MSAACTEGSSDPFAPLSLVVKKDYPVSKLDSNFEPRKRFKRSDDRVPLEGRAEEILVEIEPDIQNNDEDEIFTGDEMQKTDDQDNDDDEDLSEIEDHDNSCDDISIVTRDDFECDELSLRICRKNSGDISLCCPFCSSVTPLEEIGRHFETVHRLSRFTCPGRKCPNRIQNAKLYHEHVAQYHFDTFCQRCHESFDAKNYAEHLSSHSSHSKVVKPTILQPRNSNSASDKPAMIKPKPLELLLGYGISDNYEILLAGKLVIIDGLHFYLRNGIVFLDCFQCSKAMALSLYGSHMAESHSDRLTIECRAVNCRKKFNVATIQDHIQSQHTRIRCKLCSGKLELLQVQHHDRDACEVVEVKAHKRLTPPKQLQQPVEVVDLSVTSRSPLPAVVQPTGIHFLSHFLDDRSQAQSRSPISEDHDNNTLNNSKDEDNNTTTSCCSSIGSSVGSKNHKNNNSIENSSIPSSNRTKKKSSKNDRNGKIPTVPCPYCGKQCSYLNKHIRDVHQPKVHCPVCGKRMGKSYLSEHMKIQHQGKEVPTKVCPLCGTRVQKLKNHLKYSHKMSREEADEVYTKFYPSSNERR